MNKTQPKTIEKGNLYEQKAEKILQEQGYQVLARDYRYQKGEIDIIVQKDNCLIFVEVRYRKNTNFGLPEQTISEKKKKLISQAAEQFIFQHNWHGNIRFDVVAFTDSDVIHLQDCW